MNRLDFEISYHEERKNDCKSKSPQKGSRMIENTEKKNKKAEKNEKKEGKKTSKNTGTY